MSPIMDSLKPVLCCSRLSCISSCEHSNPGRLAAERNAPVVKQSSINMKATVHVASDADTHDDEDGDGAQRLTVSHPQTQFITVNDMKQADYIETLASDDDDR